MRAVMTNIANMGTGRRPIGASTITQQVAKNFLLTNEVSIERKIKEAILAIRMERAFSKNQLLELYMNEIYLGFGSYGVAAASLNYFDKALADLTLAEMAYLARCPRPEQLSPDTQVQGGDQPPELGAGADGRKWICDKGRRRHRHAGADHNTAAFGC